MGEDLLAAHPLRDDPLSVAATNRFAVGDRTVLAVSDGAFWLDEMRDFIGSDDDPTAAYDALVAQHGQARLPLGCFVVPGDQTVLVDTGIGPFDYSAYGMLGGNLPRQLAALGLRATDIDVVALSHLHPDHIGWLFDHEGQRGFPNAHVYLGSEDWDHFVDGTHPPIVFPDHVRSGLLDLATAGQLTLLDGDREIVDGVVRVAAPGHTPGHSAFVVQDRGEQLVLLGDALYVDQQIEHRDWRATTDVDAGLAERSRAALLDDLGARGGIAVGSHFPGLLGR